ncbi:MAG TPA: response regulator [Tepidisphaeraceae bacterium]|nr:response regulator [Tepidisphaeraceae bacterium]
MQKSHNILIVDDSATTRAMIKRVIHMTGLSVATLYEVADGNAALALLNTQTGEEAVDLVLTDLNMPGMDGVEMTRRMRTNAKLRTIPVIVITARPDNETLEMFKQESVQGWLPKPITPEGVRNVVERALQAVGGSNE